MTIRPMRQSDVEALNAMAAASGFPYPDLSDPLIETVLVVADDEDRPVMACAAKRIVELYLYCGSVGRPHAKLHMLRMFHDAMPKFFRAKGYSEVNVFIPPAVPAGFKRKLIGMFQWCENWSSLARRF